MGSTDSRSPDYYAILALPSSATSSDVKTAYHRALLAFHPDKRSSNSAADIDIGLLKEAFNVLHTPELRKEYDATLDKSRKQLGPRPAQLISLEDFTEEPDAAAQWTYPCRCGGTYVVTEDLLDAGQHVVGCASCSEVVWVGYELVEDPENLAAKE